MHYTQKRCKALYFFAALLAAAVLVLEIEYSGIGGTVTFTGISCWVKKSVPRTQFL